MSHVLMPVTPIYGHLSPMLAIGRELSARGHEVTVLTGSKYAAAVAVAGLGFLPLPAEVDYDDADLEQWRPQRPQNRIAAGRSDIISIFVRPLVAQHRALTAALASVRPDALVCEAAFLGVLPTLVADVPERRIPIVGVSTTPLALTSQDCAPFGSGLDPGDSAHTRRRNRFIGFVLQHGPLRPIQTELETALASCGVTDVAGSYFDQATRFDVTFQLAVPGIEYPRREMPAGVRFVGPLRPEAGGRSRPLPSWWRDLDGPRPVVHVTQGTLDNADPGKLVVPTLRGLAEEDVLVVASTGGRPVADVVARLGGSLPHNARVAEFLPYEALLPRTRVVVTNGGFGGVQQSLAYGVPLVVAGTTEDKPEVAARVAWSGAGINLRTGAPSPRRVRRAVLEALHDPRYAQQARRLEHQIAALGDPRTGIAEGLEELLAAERAGRVR